MSENAILLPVSVEQIAVAAKQMSSAEQKRLLELVPQLRGYATPSAVQKQATQTEAVEAVQAWVMDALDYKPLSS